MLDRSFREVHPSAPLTRGVGRRVLACAAVAAVFAASCTDHSVEADAPSPAQSAPTSTDGSTTTTSLLDGLNGSMLEAKFGKAVVMVMSRPCDGQGFAHGSGFAIDERTIVTNWHVVAEDYDDPASPVDPHPWILSYNRGWRRGTVVGSMKSPDVALVRLDDGESKLGATMSWAKSGPSEGQHLAVLGYPGLEGSEFNLTVGTATGLDGDVDGVPSFTVVRALSGRTGPGNSGGPIVDVNGSVVGVHTWGTFDRSHWIGEDAADVRDAVERIDEGAGRPTTACAADAPNRYQLSYIARLGTFANSDEAAARLEALRSVEIEGASIVAVDSDDWSPFLLSDYPVVLLGGPFGSRKEAQTAVDTYQSALDASDQTDRFSVGVIPRSAFPLDALDDSGAGDQISPLETTCIESAAGRAFVVGVNAADPLKLREDPALDSTVVTTLTGDDSLLVEDSNPVTRDGLVWIHVETADTDQPMCGWVAQRYTEMLGD